MSPQRWLRPALGLLLLLLALPFLGSVVCPRVDERAEPPDPALREGLADATPAPLPGEASATPPPAGGGREEAGPAAAAAPPVLVVRDAVSGEPLPGAVVRVRWQSAAGAPMEVRLRTDDSGRVPVPVPARGRCRARAELQGWFRSLEVPFDVPGAPAEVVLSLAPAGLIRGRIQYTDGRRHPNSGVIHFRRADAGPEAAEQWLDIHPDGSFVSPPLEAGSWLVWWTERLHGQADPRLQVVLEVEARQEREILFTVPHPKVEQRPEHQPGVQVLR